MNDYAKYFNHQMILDMVLMNEDICFHRAEFPVHQKEESFPYPKWSYQPPTEHKRMKVDVSCPVCNRRYDEASKRLEKEIVMFNARISEESVLDGAVK